jgi:two-component system, cell cycle sensor histidine kinase and response regulator CckA
MSDDFSDAHFTDALRESEERYRTLFEQAPFGVFIYDRALRITECNAAFVKVLGAPYERLIGLELLRLRDQRVVPAIEKVFDGEPSAYEGPYEAMISGWTVIVHLRCSPLRDADGDIVGGIGIVEDVTERMRVLEALRASEQRLLLHVKSSPLGVVGWNVEGKCVEWNDSAERIFGYSAAEMLGQGPDKIVPPHAKRRVFSIAERLFHKLGGERSSNENLTKDGRLIVCDWYNTSLVDPHGKVIGIASLVQDITERTRAEDALKRSEARFRQLIERAPEAIGVSRDGSWVYGNPALVTYLGFDDASQLIGTPTLERVHPSDRAAFAEQASAFPSEVRLLRRDGTPVVAEVVSMMVDYDGAPGLLTFARDLTERKQMQVRLLQADRLVSVGTLAAGVAHEINNPLAYLLANLEHIANRRLPQFHDGLLRLEEEYPEIRPRLASLRQSLSECGEMLNIAREGADRVRTIVRDLKTFSRGDEERTGPVDVHRVLDASVNMAWNEIRHSAQLVRDYGEVPLIEANEARLGQVFLNLLVNAAQAIPAGHALDNEIRVTTSTDARGGIRVEVRDSGSGIDRAAIPRIFDPFYTTKPEGVGTGLGLWICQGIVASLGGAITVDSEVGRGTTFVISLPVPDVTETERSGAEGSEPATRRGRVLVIDDEPAISRALRDGLGDEHDVVIAASGREALALLLGDDPGHFDVILCDVMMPDLDGVELYEALREKRPKLAERVVFVTGGAFAAHAREFIERVSVPTLAKPFEIERVRALIRARM